MLAAPFTMTPTYFLLDGEKKAFSPKTFTWKEQGQIRSQIPIHAFLLAQGSLFPAITDNMGDIDNPLRWTVTSDWPQQLKSDWGPVAIPAPLFFVKNSSKLQTGSPNLPM